MDSAIVISTALGAVIGAVALYALQRLPAVRRRFSGSMTSIIRSLNSIRKLFLATKRTRIETRASHISERSSISLRRLRRTLFHWYEDYPDLWPYMTKVYNDHRNELVRQEVSNLLWVEKPARELRVGDIVRRRNNDYGHVVRLFHREDGTHVIWDATHRGNSQGFFPKEAMVSTTCRGWCPILSCRYCQMGTDLCAEIGEWWWRLEESMREVRQLRTGGERFRVKGAEDANKALSGIEDHRTIAQKGMRPIQARSDNEWKHHIPARHVSDLKRLAKDGWHFTLERFDGYDNVPPIIVSEWYPPPNP